MPGKYFLPISAILVLHITSINFVWRLSWITHAVMLLCHQKRTQQVCLHWNSHYDKLKSMDRSRSQPKTRIRVAMPVSEKKGPDFTDCRKFSGFSFLASNLCNLRICREKRVVLQEVTHCFAFFYEDSDTEWYHFFHSHAYSHMVSFNVNNGDKLNIFFKNLNMVIN